MLASGRLCGQGLLTIDSPRNLIHGAMFGIDDDEVRRQFVMYFGHEIAEFELVMPGVYERWQRLDHRFSKDRDSATVVGTVFAVIARLLLSMNLLLLGHNALAGAAQRQVFEALAQAFLFSRHEWPYREQALNGLARTLTNAIDGVEGLLGQWPQLRAS